MIRLAIAAGLLLAVATWARADEAARWYVQVDNDVVTNNDRWYTGAQRIARVHREGERHVEWGLLQEVYTPEPKHFDFGVVDRVPTARLLLVHARHAISETRFETLEIAAGVRGPAALGEEVTDFVHRIIAARDVDWSRDGGNRFDGSLAWVRSESFSPMTLHYGLVAGTQVALAHATLEMRVGPGARGVSSPALRFAATPPLAQSSALGFSGFVAAGARAVFRNALLEGGYDPLAPAPRRKHAVGRLAAGIGWANACAAVSFAMVVDSREFEGQRTPHGFGSLTVQVDF